MTLTELKYIVAVARERHFGRAAETCFVAQPTLSVAIKKLGTIGVQVKIILPETKLPDKVEILDVPARNQAPVIEEGTEEDLGETIDAELAAAPDEVVVEEEVR